MIYQTLDCGNKGWFWLTFAAVGWQPKVCCIDDARRAGKKARFGSCGGFFYYWRRTRRPSALRRPPTIWRASLHLCYLRERQAANNCTSTLANFSFNTILYLPPPFVIISGQIFSSFAPSSLCIISCFGGLCLQLFFKGWRSHAPEGVPAVWREESELDYFVYAAAAAPPKLSVTKHHFVGVNIIALLMQCHCSVVNLLQFFCLK